MGHGKLKKFSENATFRCLLQPASEEVLDRAGDESRNSLALKDHPVRPYFFNESSGAFI